MKKFLAIAILALLCASPTTSFASDEISPEDAIKNVEAFYMELQKNMNKSEYDEALSIIDKHFAKDFLHYDDGEVSYGKDGMILFVENHKKMNVRTMMNIDIKETSFDPATSEVTTNFDILQKFYRLSEETGEEYEDKAGRIYLSCSDSLRVEDAQSFELYKCNCTTNEYPTAKAEPIEESPVEEAIETKDTPQTDE